MLFKKFLARLVERITGRKCCRCRHNIGGTCAHPSDGMYMRCWHGITRPGFEDRPQEIQPADLTDEEKRLMAKIVTSLQEASETAKDGGLLGTEE